MNSHRSKHPLSYAALQQKAIGGTMLNVQAVNVGNELLKQQLQNSQAQLILQREAAARDANQAAYILRESRNKSEGKPGCELYSQSKDSMTGDFFTEITTALIAFMAANSGFFLSLGQTWLNYIVIIRLGYVGLLAWVVRSTAGLLSRKSG